MARLIQAINKYGPKLELDPTVETEDVIEWVTARNRLLSSGAVKVALMGIAEAVLHFNCQGMPVRLEGLGIFTPSIGRNGAIKHGYRADAKLKQRSNAEGPIRAGSSTGSASASITPGTRRCGTPTTRTIRCRSSVTACPGATCGRGPQEQPAQPSLALLYLPEALKHMQRSF